MKRLNSRTAALAARIAELEQRRRDKAQYPSILFLVGVDATHQEETLAALLVRHGSMLRRADESEADFCARVMERAAA